MKIQKDIKLDFSDVLIEPKSTVLTSRKSVNLLSTYYFKYSNLTWTGVPLISSNMDTISTIEMYKSLHKHKIMICFHKYIDVKEIVDENCDPNYFMLSTGIHACDYDNLVSSIGYLQDNNIDVKFICIDVANGYMTSLVEFCKKVRETFPNKIIMAGSVVTPSQVELLINEGKVDVVRVGIGSGSVCTTRLQTGVGYPQLSAVLECYKKAWDLNGMIMSDGGICYPGDVSKAFGAGAKFVMMGSMFAGHTECSGDIIEENGQKYKKYYGMSSESAMNKYHNGCCELSKFRRQGS